MLTQNTFVREAISQHIASTKLLQLLWLLLCSFVLVLLAETIHVAFFGPLSKVPGPRWSALSNLPHLKWMWCGKELATVHALHKKYGSVIRLGPDNVAAIGNPQTFKEIYGHKAQGQHCLDKDLVFYDRPFNNIPGPISSPNQAGSRMRKVLSPAFSEQAMKKYEHRLKFWATRLEDRLRQNARKGLPSDMVKMFNCATFDILSDLVFIEPLHMLDNSEYVPWVRLIFSWVKLSTHLRVIRYSSRASNAVIDFVTRYSRRLPAIRDHHGYLNDRIEHRMQTEPAHPDIWSLVIQDTTESGRLLEGEHYSIASELMVAGTETAATATSGCLFYLLENPKWMAKLTQELRDEHSKSESLTLTSLQSNGTLNAIIHEALRLYPPFPVGMPRIVPHGGIELNEYFIPQGTRVSVYPMPTCRDPQSFHRADEFYPERWLDDPEFKHDKLDTCQPFSVGPRNCLGQNFAWHEMRLLLATVLIHFDVTLLPESRGWREQDVYVLWEKSPLMCQMHERREQPGS